MASIQAAAIVVKTSLSITTVHRAVAFYGITSYQKGDEETATDAPTEHHCQELAHCRRWASIEEDTVLVIVLPSVMLLLLSTISFYFVASSLSLIQWVWLSGVLLPPLIELYSKPYHVFARSVCNILRLVLHSLTIFYIIGTYNSESTAAAVNSIQSTVHHIRRCN